jgi:hypothetical protein
VKLHIEQERKLYTNLRMLYIEKMLYNDQQKLANEQLFPCIEQVGWRGSSIYE